ncbi:single-stranded-DNA-specific exonuclease [Bacillus ectoiniformans]|uniref:single-stranded-DNA-specific exonuclease RecJ n=1 Tax=Bacillus ectoiniformans TaxID=1494429 RepID=UPI00195774AD|nr:single-stranded-DNA-specific exonuclease RecJ [Bacillus ectoiniformans]MBM7648994.1 single-stranded-DNA-specific exonuclease [Bacillus ectoiniformans]
MLKSKTRWIVRQTDEKMRDQLAEELAVSPMLASLLINRGLNDAESARSFLMEKGEEFHDPYLMLGMDQAVSRIHEAIKNEEAILVFGDYDGDGVTSTSVMLTVLKDLGANAEFYIPNRFTEGYGPNEQAFRWAKDTGFSLIITVDTGISAVNEAALAKELGMDLIITDHHEPGPELPEALAIIHPKHPDGHYPFHYLAGVGVAFKVAHALYGHVPEHLLDLAAIGTIADLVPLKGENRSLAKAGLQKLKQTSRPGINALCKLTSTDKAAINEETIGFMIAPRLNAAGRLADADPAVELLMTDDAETAAELAKEIDSLNKERQTIVNDITLEAMEMVENEFPPEDYPVIVIGKEGWNAGVIGIVASRLVDKYYRPAIVLSFDPETGKAKGSARSIKGFDLFKNLSTCRDILPHFGGHPMAAGMTLEIANVDLLRERLTQLAGEQLTEDDFIPITELDAAIPVEDVTLQAIEQLQKLSPYGMGNPKPRVMIEEANLSVMKKIGSDQTHLKLMLEQQGATLDGIGFGMGTLADHIAPFSKVSVIGELAINEWNNISKPQIFLKDVRVNNWQLFDARGHRQIQKWLKEIPDKRVFITFKEETLHDLKLQDYEQEVVQINSSEQAELFSIDQKNLVLLDMPSSAELIEKLMKNGEPERVYAHFHQKDNHFFSTMPTREHFKWFYAFLNKRKVFDLNTHGDELAKYKGWSRETVDFMSKVFFELEFVTMDKGFLHLNPAAGKRDLSESPSYQNKQMQYELENKLLYSSYQDLKDWMSQYIYLPVKNREEENTWI